MLIKIQRLFARVSLVSRYVYQEFLIRCILFNITKVIIYDCCRKVIQYSKGVVSEEEVSFYTLSGR